MDKNDQMVMEEPKWIEFDYLVENISAKQIVYLYCVVGNFLNSHNIFDTGGNFPLHFIIKIDTFRAQQLLEIITAYVESHYLQMAGGFHIIREGSTDVQTP